LICIRYGESRPIRLTCVNVIICVSGNSCTSTGHLSINWN
jgi:hypothetical protein